MKNKMVEFVTYLPKDYCRFFDHQIDIDLFYMFKNCRKLNTKSKFTGFSKHQVPIFFFSVMFLLLTTVFLSLFQFTQIFFWAIFDKFFYRNRQSIGNSINNRFDWMFVFFFASLISWSLRIHTVVCGRQVDL